MWKGEKVLYFHQIPFLLSLWMVMKTRVIVSCSPDPLFLPPGWNQSRSPTSGSGVRPNWIPNNLKEWSLRCLADPWPCTEPTRQGEARQRLHRVYLCNKPCWAFKSLYKHMQHIQHGTHWWSCQALEASKQVHFLCGRYRRKGNRILLFSSKTPSEFLYEISSTLENKYQGSHWNGMAHSKTN